MRRAFDTSGPMATGFARHLARHVAFAQAGLALLCDHNYGSEIIGRLARAAVPVSLANRRVYQSAKSLSGAQARGAGYRA